MGNEVEARTQRVRNHLQRPDHSDWQLTNARIRSTVYLTAPRLTEELETVPPTGTRGDPCNLSGLRWAWCLVVRCPCSGTWSQPVRRGLLLGECLGRGRG